ncbi:hypothetical protein Goklo_009930 [Gossypium klotzschianum]|uniref:Uncharacterized protein n=1 Tax=Gossypium klotzschianum TaxID=34286 RepID=A0A7J8V4F9_9ROSI|nr:hypothetical protein [Gossypium klotzschianum]
MERTTETTPSYSMQVPQTIERGVVASQGHNRRIDLRLHLMRLSRTNPYAAAFSPNLSIRLAVL